MSITSMNMYEAAGGAEGIKKLVTAFYNRVAQDPILKPLFPEDFTEIRQRQYAFLSQFFGGPALYSQQYGAPMMRMRHLRFPIQPIHADAWLQCMAGAMDEVGIQGPLREVMFERITLTAKHMVNTETDGSQDL